MKAYTDYPIRGNKTMREIDVLSYDRDKYVSISDGGEVVEIKAGYLFTDISGSKRVSHSKLFSLPISKELPPPSRKQIHNERMSIRRRKETKYAVFIGDTPVIRVSSLREALKVVVNRGKGKNCQIDILMFHKTSITMSTMLLVRQGVVEIITNRGRALKTHHVTDILKSIQQ